MKRRIIKGISLLCCSIVLLSNFIWYQNNLIGITKVEYESEKLPETFEGFNIIQLTDLHNKSFGDKQQQLVKKVKNLNPDIIVITGDLIDHTKEGNGADVLIEQLVLIAPVYYVTGNHEAWAGTYDILKDKLLSLGVTVLDDEAVTIRRGVDEIELIGVIDPAFMPMIDEKVMMQDALNSVIADNDNFKILLSHRPELFDLYVDANVNLVFSGHAHGGQFRLPFIGGLVAPDQGLFPQYSEGVHTMNDTTMIVSRGLGNSIIPVRLFNRPEIVSVTLAVSE